MTTGSPTLSFLQRGSIFIRLAERGEDDVIAYHLRQPFRPGEIIPEEACELARRFTKGNHVFIVCTHIDRFFCTEEIHEEPEATKEKEAEHR